MYLYFIIFLLSFIQSISTMQPDQPLTVAQNAGLGAAMSVVESVACQPLENTKNRIMLVARTRPELSKIKQLLIAISLNPRFLWKGTDTSILAAGPIIAMQMAITRALSTLNTDIRLPDTTRACLNSALSGALSAILVCPRDLIIQTQSDQKMNLRQALQYIITAPQGSKSHRYLWRALSLVALRESIYCAGYQVLPDILYGVIKKKMPNCSNAKAKALSYALAAAFSTYASQPFERLRNALHGDIHAQRYSGARHAFTDLARQSGLRALATTGGLSRLFLLWASISSLDLSRTKLMPYFANQS